MMIHMAIVEAKIKKWGNSIGLLIPSNIIKIEDLHIGDKIKVDIIKERRINAFGMLKGAPPYEREDEGHGEF